jgi:manganese transport protein
VSRNSRLKWLCCDAGAVGLTGRHPSQTWNRSRRDATDSAHNSPHETPMPDSPSPSATPGKRFLSALGPAIITASVVLGPGSILANSTTGANFGYSLAWVLVIAVVLMIGMVALSTRLGVLMEGTFGEEIARRAGRPGAVVVGVTIFLIAGCFQFSNNLGVLFAIEPFARQDNITIKYVAIVAMNLLAISALLCARNLYKAIERLMKFLVAMMVCGFVGNLIMARPDLKAILTGLIPSLPEGALETIVPRRVAGDDGTMRIIDRLTPVVAMIGTTFSIAAAYYQSYLVRQKGWTKADYKTGITDTLTGIGMLGFISFVIMCTASAAFYQNPDVQLPENPTAADFAMQLEPTFGPTAMYLFCMGIFAGAFSSFLVNALVGGALLSDGCGKGGRMEDSGVRVATVAALLLGMFVALYTVHQGESPGKLILFAQALTVIGNPLVAAVILWLATRKDIRPDISTKLIVIAVVSFLFTSFLAVRMAISVYYRLNS